MVRGREETEAPFWTTVSLRNAFSAPLVRSDLHNIFKHMGVQEPVPDSLPESSRTLLSSVWFAGTTPEGDHQ